MKIRKILPVAALALVFTAAGIQAQAQVDVGIRAGLNLNNVSSKDGDGDRADTKINPGFHAGLTFDIPIADEFYIQPAALYSMKGFKTTSDASIGGFNYDGEVRWNASYIEVPVNFLYKPALGMGHLLLGAGPYVGYGLGGKVSSDNNIDWGNGEANSSDHAKLEFLNDNNDFSGDDDKVPYAKPFDYGANLLAGYEFANKFSVQLNAQLGLADIQPDNDGNKQDGSLRNVNFGVSVGYKF
ncbi:hypothetical protein GCM10027051_07250 [Niabella terrae]